MGIAGSRPPFDEQAWRRREDLGNRAARRLLIDYQFCPAISRVGWARHRKQRLAEYTGDTRLVQVVDDPRDTPELNVMRENFARLVAKLRSDTMAQSSSAFIFSHPSYLEILTMGRAAIPLILEEMRANPNLWFWALRILTGDDAAKGLNSVAEACDAWLDWGRKRGHVS